MPFFIARGSYADKLRGAREGSTTVDKDGFGTREAAVRAAEERYAGERWQVVEAQDAKTAAFTAAGVRPPPDACGHQSRGKPD